MQWKRNCAVAWPLKNSFKDRKYTKTNVGYSFDALFRCVCTVHKPLSVWTASVKLRALNSPLRRSSFDISHAVLDWIEIRNESICRAFTLNHVHVHFILNWKLFEKCLKMIISIRYYVTMKSIEIDCSKCFSKSSSLWDKYTTNKWMNECVYGDYSRMKLKIKTD